MKRIKLLPMITIVLALSITLTGCGASQDASQNEVTEETKQVETVEPDGRNEVNTENQQVPTPAEQTAEGSSSDEQTIETGEISPELKGFLDSYEAFMDEYVEFMENYKASDLSMLSKYTELLSKYAEFAQKAEEWEGKELNNKELIYYTEVLGRVSQKLLQVSVGN